MGSTVLVPAGGPSCSTSTRLSLITCTAVVAAAACPSSHCSALSNARSSASLLQPVKLVASEIWCCTVSSGPISTAPSPMRPGLGQALPSQ